MTDRWSSYLPGPQPDYAFTQPSNPSHIPQVDNFTGVQPGQQGSYTERTDAMSVARPPSSMSDIVNDYSLPSNASSDSLMTRPGSTPAGTGHGDNSPYGLSQPSGQPNSTLQNLLLGTATPEALPAGSLTTSAMTDVFSNNSSPMTTYNLAFGSSANRGSSLQFVDKYSAAFSLESSARKQLQRMFEVSKYT